MTQLRFTHHGLVPAIECYKDCSNAWGQLIQQSLFSLMTTGKEICVGFAIGGWFFIIHFDILSLKMKSTCLLYVFDLSYNLCYSQ
jgi:hypothetical protein